MLAEWIKSFRTPCPRHLRAMGYLKELIAMEARHRRCRDAWRPHLENCKKLILDAATGIPRNRVTVLGSGLLLDVPLEELSVLFREVTLVDILHLPQVRRRVRDYPNVRLETVDVTGIAETVYRHVREGRVGPLPAPRADSGVLADSDLVISANMLTQLPLMPMGYLRDKGKITDEDELHQFARRIVEHHLELLAALPGRIALLTETARLVIDGDNVLHEIDPLFGARAPKTGRKWTWEIAPRPELSARYDLLFRMTGIADLSGAGPGA